MRQCPRCGRLFPEDRKVCNLRTCKRKTVEVIDWTDGDEARAMEDLEEGILLDPFDKAKAEPEPDLREDLKGQSDQIHDLLEHYAAMTYEEIGNALGVSTKRASNLISQMVRDGVDLKREGRPRKVSLR